MTKGTKILCEANFNLMSSAFTIRLKSGKKLLTMDLALELKASYLDEVTH